MWVMMIAAMSPKDKKYELSTFKKETSIFRFERNCIKFIEVELEFGS